MEHAQLGGVVALFKKAWARMRERYAGFVLPSLIVWAGLIAVVVLGRIFFGLSMAGTLLGVGAALPENSVLPLLTSAGFWVLMVVFGLAIAVLSLWQTSALTFVAVTTKKPSFKEVWSAGWKYFWPLVWLQFLLGLIIYGSLFLFLVPAIYLGIALSFGFFVCVHEGTRGMGALLRSKELVKGNWWRVLWRFLIVGVAVFIPYFVFVFLGGDEGFILAMVLQMVAIAYQLLFMTPFIMSFMGELYLELVGLKPTPAPQNLKKSRWKFAILTIVGYVVGSALLVTPLILLSTISDRQTAVSENQTDPSSVNEWDEN